MSIQGRNSTLDFLFVNTVGSTGIVQLGDGVETTLRSKAIAVQRAIPNYVDDEFRFAAYPLFFLPKKWLQPCVDVEFQSVSPLPNIHVGLIRTLGVSASSLLRIGLSGPIKAESRIKHIRHFNNRVIR